MRGGLAMVQLGATWGNSLEGPVFDDMDLDGVDAALMACRTAAENAADAGFDAIEMLCMRGTPEFNASFVRDALSAVMAVWPASRVGICLTWPEDAVEYAATSALLTSTRDLGLAHAHLVAANRANDPTAGTTAERLRAEVPGALIVSGAWTPATALAAIESRAVDAVGVDGTFRLEGVG
jgi:2,4-dienoyl-CoA reductase-like NADH-dependent reductase (Old Yellow Enzyme family)